MFVGAFYTSIFCHSVKSDVLILKDNFILNDISERSIKQSEIIIIKLKHIQSLSVLYSSYFIFTPELAGMSYSS